jgi:hypothetical protein
MAPDPLRGKTTANLGKANFFDDMKSSFHVGLIGDRRCRKGRQGQARGARFLCLHHAQIASSPIAAFREIA